jgi:hypothetical protein
MAGASRIKSPLPQPSTDRPPHTTEQDTHGAEKLLGEESMGLLSTFFIANGSPVPNYEGGEEFDDADKCQFAGLTPLEGAQLLAVLRGETYQDDMISEFTLVTPEDAEDWTMAVPPDFVNALAGLEANEIPGLAAKFAEATAEELGSPADDFVPLISDLSSLARRALESGKTMFLWNSL